MNKNFRVVNAVYKGIISPEWKTPLENLLMKIGTSRHRLAKNYLPENMNLAEHLSFDLLVAADNEIVSFAGVYNGGRYPEGVYRILNRTWVAESFRVKDGAFPFLSSKYILPVQLENLQSELKIIFVSREKPSGRLFLKRWRENQPDPSDWVLSEKMIQVVPEVYKRSCFQHICYKKFCEVKWTPVHIEEKAWHELAQSKP